MDRLLKKLRPIRCISFLLALLVELGGVIPIYFMPLIIDRWIPEKNLQNVLWAVLIFCGIPLLLALLNVFYKVILMNFTKRMSDELRLRCFEKLLHQPMSFFNETHSAELTQRCSQETTDFITVEAMDKPTVWANCVICVILLTLLIQISPWLALLQLLYFAVIVPLVKLCGKKLEGYIRQILDGNAKRNKTIQEGFHAVRTLKAFQQESYPVSALNQVQTNIRKIWSKDVALENLVGGLSSHFLPSVIYGATFVLAAMFVMQGEITLGLLTSAAGYSTRLHGKFQTLFNTFTSRKKAKVEADTIARYLELSDEREHSGSKHWSFEKEICFENVSFRYNQDQPDVLKQLDLHFPKGKWVGISGASGAGKTTILELLLRFYECQEGKILVDGVNLGDIQLSEIRENIGYVPQEPFLLDASVVENLRLAKPNVSQEEIEAILKTVHLDPVFSGERMNDRLGESGLNISGGERQRITIAQCLLRGASVILLDEATSQLDEDNQQMIQRIFHQLAQNGITIISVAHRDSFNTEADIQYVLQ